MSSDQHSRRRTLQTLEESLRTGVARLPDANHPGEQDAYSIDVFCQRNGISKSFYHKLQGQGLGPRTMRLGSRVLITREDARTWRKQRTAAPTPTA